MKGLRNFIAEIPKKYSDTFKTDNGVELYVDRHFSVKTAANTIVRVVETPLNYQGKIKIGSLIFIDATVLIQQTYIKTGEQENIHLIDREKNLYKINPELVIAYSNDEGENWEGFRHSCIAEKIEEKVETVKSDILFIPNSEKKKNSETKFKLYILNEEAKKLGLNVGDTVYIKKHMFVDVRFKDKTYTWLRNKDLMAVEC